MDGWWMLLCLFVCLHFFLRVMFLLFKSTTCAHFSAMLTCGDNRDDGMHT